MNFNKLTKQSALIAAIVILFSLQTARGQSTDSYPQNRWYLNVGIDPTLHTGKFYNERAFLPGGDLRLQYTISRPVAIVATAGYLENVASKNVFGAGSRGMIPLEGGVKVSFSHFYISEQAGVALSTASNYDTDTVITSGIGYAIANTGIDIGVDYSHFKYAGDFVGLRIAYGFKL